MGAAQRKILFIEKAFQVRFIIKVLSIILLGMTLTGTCLYLFGNYQIDRMYASAHFDIRESWEVYQQAVLVASFFSMTLVAFLAVFFALRDSHKIGGPLYRFRLNLKQIGDGDLTTNTFLRDGDELRPFVDSMNEMTDALKDKVVAIRDAQSDLCKQIEEAKASTDSAKLEEIEKKCAAISASLNAFKVDQ
jgi:methyl-accepting chemotaxis protein